VEEQLKFRRLLYRQVARLGALENLVDILRGQLLFLAQAGAIRNQPACIGKFAKPIDCGQATAQCEVSNPLRVKVHERVRKNCQCLNERLRHAGKAAANWLGSLTSNAWTVRLNLWAASCVRRYSGALFASSGLYRAATRDRPETSLPSNSSRLPARSEEIHVSPVALPPGRARLMMRLSSGSHASTTIGMISVACFAARSP